MAESPAHQWGQIIGQEFLEVAIEPLLRRIARKHKLYLDCKGFRPARKGKKISWIDLYGNTHDLDFVLERGGTTKQIGTPVAFIETAWRRYTKHSRNKAQEIQGAILPLVTTHQHHAPFIGVILAGDFTEGALTQLKSQRFRVLYFPYQALVSVFPEVGIDATFDEDTPDAECAAKVAAWKDLSGEQRQWLGKQLLARNASQVRPFIQALESAITRSIGTVRVLPLHGTMIELESVGKAIAFVESYDEQAAPERPIARYEIQIRYNNGDQINGAFSRKEEALEFLRSYQPGLRPLT